jgi:hypothetical protein
VTEVLTGGKNTAFLKLKTGVCQHCGERLFSADMIKRFEEIETKLKKQNTSDFKQIGKSFQVL